MPPQGAPQPGLPHLLNHQKPAPSESRFPRLRLACTELGRIFGVVAGTGRLFAVTPEMRLAISPGWARVSFLLQSIHLLLRSPPDSLPHPPQGLTVLSPPCPSSSGGTSSWMTSKALSLVQKSAQCPSLPPHLPVPRAFLRLTNVPLKPACSQLRQAMLRCFPPAGSLASSHPRWTRALP